MVFFDDKLQYGFHEFRLGDFIVTYTYNTTLNFF